MSNRLVLSALAAVALTFGLASAQNSLSIATGGTGGTYYPTGGAYAELINNYIDGYTAAAESTGASVANSGFIARGESDIALALADTVLQAYTGTGNFGGDGEPPQLPNLRALGVAYANTVHLVTLADSGIESLADLEGTRVSVGAPGSGTEVSAKSILEANGITYDDIDEQRLNFNETAAALRDGDIDAGFWSVGPPTSSILDLATTRDIEIVSIEGEELENGLGASDVFAPVTLPAGTYTGVDEDVSTIGTPNVILVAAEMDEQLAYDFLDVLYTNIDEVIAVHPSANNTTPELSLAASPIPFHPGAVQYFEDNGYEVPADLMPPN